MKNFFIWLTRCNFEISFITKHRLCTKRNFTVAKRLAWRIYPGYCS